MRGKKRPPQERVSSVAGPLPPCRVCGEQAAGFHYGVNTCEACKGFFRRSLLRDGKYECAGAGNCAIGSSRRKSCPKCRYLKCLSVGMSKEAIKTGRYTYMKRTQDTLELKMLEETKLKHVTDVDIKKEVLSDGVVKSPDSFESGIVAADVKDKINWNCKSPSGLSSAIAEIINSPVSKPPSPSVPTRSQPFGEHMPVLTAELVSLSTLPQGTLTFNRMEELNGRGEISGHKLSHSTFSNLSQGMLVSDVKSNSPLCSTLLSPLSMTEGCDMSPSPHKGADSGHSKTELSPGPQKGTDADYSKREPSPGCSPFSSPVVSKNWHVYSEAELDSFISDLVTNHKMNVEDSNSITDEVLQVMFKECKERCSLQTEIFGHMGIIKRDEHDQIYISTGLDVDGRLDDLSYAAEKMDVYIRQMITFMKLIPGFRSLHLSDQTALVKASIYDIFLLGYFRGYNKKDYIVVEPTRSYCRHQMEVFQSVEDLDKIFYISQRLQNLHLTFEMVIVLKALCVFFPDRATLEEPDNIEQLQYKIVQSLLLLLRRQFSDQTGVMFGRIISVLMHSRNYAEDCQKFIVTQMFTGTYMERFDNVPILLELFSSSVG